MQTKNTFNTKKLGLFGLVTVATLGATALANAETYTVQKGDTLSAIAKKNGTTVDEIVSKNGIQDANKIYIGQKLTINETTEEPAEIPALVETSTYSTQVKVTKRPTQIFLLQRQLLRKKSLNVSQVVATQPKTDNIMDVINYLHHI